MRWAGRWGRACFLHTFDVHLKRRGALFVLWGSGVKNQACRVPTTRADVGPRSERARCPVPWTGCCSQLGKLSGNSEVSFGLLWRELFVALDGPGSSSTV